MIDKYYMFDVDKFLQDYNINHRRLAELIAERDAIADSSGMDYGHVRGTGISDPTAQRVNRRLKLESEINELVEYMAAYDKLTDNLGSEEQKVIQYLAKRGKTRQDLVWLANSLGYSESATYRLVTDLRRKLRRIAK